jgi:hypothetical protein
MRFIRISELEEKDRKQLGMLVKDAVLEADVHTKHHLDLLKKVAAAWEVAPHWSFCQLVNYLLNFCEHGDSKLYNNSDADIIAACDGIVTERDAQAALAFYTKPLLISKFRPQSSTDYLTAARDILTSDEYEQVLGGIISPDTYDEMPRDLKIVVDSYFTFDK